MNRKQWRKKVAALMELIDAVASIGFDSDKEEWRKTREKHGAKTIEYLCLPISLPLTIIALLLFLMVAIFAKILTKRW